MCKQSLCTVCAQYVMQLWLEKSLLKLLTTPLSLKNIKYVLERSGNEERKNSERWGNEWVRFESGKRMHTYIPYSFLHTCTVWIYVYTFWELEKNSFPIQHLEYYYTVRGCRESIHNMASAPMTEKIWREEKVSTT